MEHTETEQGLVLATGRIGKYLDVETTLSFSDPNQELESLRAGCGVFHLNWRALVSVTGKDRVRWLHNMVTNSVRDLQLNRGAYNFVLNAHGRILGDLNIFNRGEFLLLETDRSQVESLLATLRRFIIMDKVELSDLGPGVTAIGMAGPKSGQVLSAAGIEPIKMQPLEIQDAAMGGADIQIIRGAEQKPNWFEIWIDIAHAPAIARKLTDCGAQPVGVEALEMWRVLRGIPQYGKDIRDRDLPQETGQIQALNFNKGCYIGQEIVERIRSRGQVHRKFTGFEFAGNAPSLGKFESEGRSIAELTSVARVSGATGEREIGMGYVRVESVPENGVLNLNGTEARVVDLPF
ncbi:MAG TPA: folate-binding protein [Candidatus Angelobacter sp.]|nr:folate-binding protein [Candidatus Angelobacter sp.]